MIRPIPENDPAKIESSFLRCAYIHPRPIPLLPLRGLLASVRSIQGLFYRPGRAWFSNSALLTAFAAMCSMFDEVVLYLFLFLLQNPPVPAISSECFFLPSCHSVLRR